LTFRVIKIIPVSDRYEGLLEENVQGAESILSDGREISMEAKQLDVPSNETRPSVPRTDSHNRALSRLGTNEPLVQHDDQKPSTALIENRRTMILLIG
jgi:hypothetical protein